MVSLLIRPGRGGANAVGDPAWASGEHTGLVVEPSAALGVAAVLEDRDRFVGRHVVTVICGSNVDLDAYHHWVHP
jgi:threonine dehydratase